MAKQQLKLMVGGDPEVFLRDMNTERVIPSCGLIGGTKKTPKPINKNVSILEDNVTIELNYTPVEYEPGSSAPWKMAQHAYKSLDDHLRTLNLHYAAYLAPECKFDAKQLASDQAKEFGCNPDLNAWLGDNVPNARIDPSELGGYRFAGGHFHFGFDTDKCDIPVPYIVQMLDGLVTARWCGSNKYVVGPLRRNYYGKAGSYRRTPYGFEYRTLSNYWLQNSDLFNDVVGTVHWLINHTNEAYPIFQKIEALGTTIRDYIEGKSVIANPTTIINNALEEHRGMLREYIRGRSEEQADAAPPRAQGNAIPRPARRDDGFAAAIERINAQADRLAAARPRVAWVDVEGNLHVDNA